jgi:hypothetical protein
MSMIDEHRRNLEGTWVHFPVGVSEYANTPEALMRGEQATGVVIHQDYEGTLVVVVEGWEQLNGLPLAHHVALRYATIIPNLDAGGRDWTGWVDR